MKTLIILLTFFAIILTSCRKEKELLVTQDFPSTIGSWWMYQVLDQNNVVLDTLTVRIISTTSIYGANMQVWTNTTSKYTDTIYVLPANNSITFYTFNDVEYLSFNFPIISNQPWTTPMAGVSYTTGSQNITINNITYNGCTYLNQYQAPLMGTSINESIWIAKQIGIIKHVIDNIGSSPYANEELIAYHIN
jgi:hypothetical protein